MIRRSSRSLRESFVGDDFLAKSDFFFRFWDTDDENSFIYFFSLLYYGV